ncbi:MAG TPA: hypothetical protein VGL18_08435 [Actinomycetota bacterium]
MRLRSRNAIALAIVALILIGAGVAVAQSQSPSPSPSSSRQGKSAILGRSEFLDDVARRLGIQRSRLHSALKAMALAEVNWAEDNGFITKTRADLIRQRINSGDAKGLGRFGLHGPLGFGHDGLGLHGGFFKGHIGRGFGLLTAAANYLGLSKGNLVDALRSKTLAQVARDQDKSMGGLEAALRAAKKAELDDAVTSGEITSAQENALLERFGSQIGDVVNGIPPALTDLARRLGIARPRLITAIKDAAIDRVDAALAKGDITKAQADAIKQRIRSSPAWPLAGSIGLCGGPGRFGFGFGALERGSRFDHSGYGEDAIGL